MSSVIHIVSKHCFVSSHRELDLSSEHPALAMFDMFKSQLTEDIFSFLEKKYTQNVNYKTTRGLLTF